MGQDTSSIRDHFTNSNGDVELSIIDTIYAVRQLAKAEFKDFQRKVKYKA